jgi:hypothetical protein
MLFFKRLFCKHLWQQTKEVFLRKQREDMYANYCYMTPLFKDFNYYAVEQKCYRCGKERIVQKRRVII